MTNTPGLFIRLWICRCLVFGVDISVNRNATVSSHCWCYTHCYCCDVKRRDYPSRVTFREVIRRGCCNKRTGSRRRIAFSSRQHIQKLRIAATRVRNVICIQFSMNQRSNYVLPQQAQGMDQLAAQGHHSSSVTRTALAARVVTVVFMVLNHKWTHLLSEATAIYTSDTMSFACIVNLLSDAHCCHMI